MSTIERWVQRSWVGLRDGTESRSARTGLAALVHARGMGASHAVISLGDWSRSTFDDEYVPGAGITWPAEVDGARRMDGLRGCPRQTPDGIAYVLVNGETVIDHHQHTGKTPGRVLGREARQVRGTLRAT